MTVFRADARLPRATRLVAGMLIAALPAVAIAQPIQLRRPTPEVVKPETATPGTLAPQAVTPQTAAPANEPSAAAPTDGAGETSPDASPAVRGDRSGIVVNPLAAVDPDAFGLLSEEQGGFPVDVWRGVDWPTVKALMPRMPGLTTSAATRRLASRLLLSRALVPDGKPIDESFVALRVDRLLAMGDVANALALLKVVPEQRRDQAFSRTEVETLFFDNRNAEACARIRAVAAQFTEVYWKQAQAFCLALGGDHARAGLIADLLREREDEVEPAFFSIIEVLGGLGDVEVSEIGRADGLLLAMMRAASLRLPSEIADSDKPVVLRWVARAPNAELDVRLAAAEKSFAAGALTAEEILKFYLSIPFSREELDNPISVAEANWGPRGRALLIRSAATQNVALAKAEVLRRGWQIAREKGGYAEMVRASAAIVATVEPTAELMWFARNAAHVMFSAGRPSDALAWYGIVSADRERIDEAKTAEAALWPLALLADTEETVTWDQARLETWYAGLQSADPDNALKRGLALFNLLDALGRDVPPAAWRVFLRGPLGSPDAPLHRAWARTLDAASAASRTGETVLLATIGSTADGGKSFNASLSASAAIAALRRIGLEGEARLMALETALAAGL